MIVAAAIGDHAANVYGVGSLVVGGLALWNKSQPSQEENAQAEYKEKKRVAEDRRAARRKVEEEVEGWREERSKQQRAVGRFRPAPADVAPPGTGMVFMGRVGIDLPALPNLELPDSLTARQTCAQVVAGLVRSVVQQADDHAAVLRSLAADCWRTGRYRTLDREGQWSPIQQGQRLTPEAEAAVEKACSWVVTRDELLSGLHSPVNDVLRPLHAHGARFQSWQENRSKAYDPPGSTVLPGGEWHTFLLAMADDFADAADKLDALPPYQTPPKLSPTGIARLKENTVAEAVEERITQYVRKHAQRLQDAPEGGFLMESQDWDEATRLLTDFRTADIGRRFTQTTAGFPAVSRWNDTMIAAGVRSRMHCVFATFALTYLVEVLKSMPDYADHSGENIPPQGIVINAGVVNMAHSLNIIGSNMAAVIQRGDTESAEAVNALSAAVQASQSLNAQERAEQLENVADVATAVAEPEADGNRRRGRNALAALTAATGASSQITQVIEQWQHIFSSLR
ncbi:hypothetical protein [Streptomyces sp. NPDC005345]|uniref:hypothetical protein n=1 Tax=Streptomyces sp. NPDC005345 TaxID=3156877 RepID=UPI0033BF5974